jgi:hypothetical protein
MERISVHYGVGGWFVRALVGRVPSVGVGAHRLVKPLRHSAAVLTCLMTFLCAGCQQPQAGRTDVAQPLPAGRSEPSPPRAEGPYVSANLPTGYAPARITILPLTELISASGSAEDTSLNVFVALSDAFGSNMKAPGILRFELYRRISRSAEPKGQRLAIWSDIDLIGPTENNRYWRDFLRAYEFVLETDADPSETYILEATCIGRDGRRLSTEFTLKPSQ